MAFTMVTPTDFVAYPWMKFAFQEYGQTELRGNRHNNPQIMSYLATCGPWPKDETPWCSAFANWCMRQAHVAGTNKANARSWLTWGSTLNVPTYGCVAVMYRLPPGSAKGHVAFYVGSDGGSIWLLGGNQNNSVSLKTYGASHLLGYRWPVGYAVPA